MPFFLVILNQPQLQFSFEYEALGTVILAHSALNKRRSSLFIVVLIQVLGDILMKIISALGIALVLSVGNAYAYDNGSDDSTWDEITSFFGFGHSSDTGMCS